MFNQYKLTRWARLIKIRDQAICFMCGKKEGIYRMESHHIYPKRDPRYREKAYDLKNGICLCWDCHRKKIHSSWTNWRRFCIMFKAHIRRKKIKKFNIERKLSFSKVKEN